MSDANVWNYVIGAYTVTWLGLIVYGIRLLVLNRRAVAAVAAADSEGME